MGHRIAGAIFFFLYLLSSVIHAATLTWDGGGDGTSFGNAANWNPNQVPVPEDDLVLGAQTPDVLSVSSANLGFADFFVNSISFTRDNASVEIQTQFGPDQKNLKFTGTHPIQNIASNATIAFTLPVEIDQSEANPTVDAQQAGSSIVFNTNLDVVLFDAPDTVIFSGNGNIRIENALTESQGGIGFNVVNVSKTGSGALVLGSGAGLLHKGWTTLSGGDLQLGADDQLPNAAGLAFNGGNLKAGGFDLNMPSQPLKLTATSTIDFGSGASAMAFADSSGQPWSSGAILNIVNFTVGVDSLLFGNSSAGLTAQQLSQIRFNQNTPAQVNAEGFVTPSESASDIAAWRGLFFSESELANSSLEATLWGDDADPDADGLENLVEYFMALNPREPGGSRVFISKIDDSLFKATFRRSRSAADITYRVEFSSTLLEGSWSTDGIVEVVVDDIPVNYQLVEVSIPRDSVVASGFFRLVLLAQ